jgi:hypothetical protein
MSHFSVLVITKGHPLDNDGKELGEALAPFHEFECTGRNDEHVCELDITEDTRNDYEKGTKTLLVDLDGNKHDPYATEFYRDATQEELANRYTSECKHSWGCAACGTKDKIRFVPDGWTEKEFPFQEIMTFAEYCEYEGTSIIPADGEIDSEDKHKFRFAMLDGKGEILKVVKRTNVDKWKFVLSDGKVLCTQKGNDVPRGIVKLQKEKPIRPGLVEFDISYRIGNKDGLELKRIRIGGDKWDRWTIGGRYADKFADKDGQSTDFIQCKDLDKDRMLRRNINHNEGIWNDAEREYQRRPSVVSGKTLAFEEHLAHFHKISDEVRELAKAQGKSPNDVWEEYIGEDKINPYPFEMFYGIGRKSLTKELYLADTHWLTSFAYLKDGEWHERGNMGWFACVSDEKEGDAWQAEVEAMIASLEPGDWITCVDCHI